MTNVLIVEDEESLADPLAFLLRKEGFEATVVGDGPSALAEFDRAGADIVLLEKDLGVLVEGVREGRTTFANTLKYIFINWLFVLFFYFNFHHPILLFCHLLNFNYCSNL